MSLHALPAFLLLVAACLTAGAASKPKPEKPVKADDGFKEFALIPQRNVFNANRSLTPVVPPAPKAPRPPTVEAFALLGTMSSERGAVAFFDGTSSGYRKAAQTGDKLGAYTVVAIAHDRVTLKNEDREQCLPINMQFRREGEGEWLLTPLPEDFQPTAPPPGNTLLANRAELRDPVTEQIRDSVSSKYQRKLEQLANDPVRAEKLLKAMNGEIASRIRKLDKVDRREP